MHCLFPAFRCEGETGGTHLQKHLLRPRAFARISLDTSLRPLGQDNKCDRELAAELVRDADDADVCDVRVVEQVALELGWGDLEAADFEELLDAVDDEELFALGEDDFVSGADPPAMCSTCVSGSCRES